MYQRQLVDHSFGDNFKNCAVHIMQQVVPIPVLVFTTLLILFLYFLHLNTGDALMFYLRPPFQLCRYLVPPLLNGEKNGANYY